MRTTRKTTNRTVCLNDPARTPLKELNYSAATFLDGLIVCYGARGSGKTTSVLNVMKSVRDEVDEVYVISQSAGANDQFGGYVPARAIKTDFNPQWFQGLLNRQKEKAARYRKAQDLRHLEDLFDMCASRKERTMRDVIIAQAAKFGEQAKEEYDMPDEQEYEVLKINRRMEQLLRELYQMTIREYKRFDLNQLTAVQRAIVEILETDMNPRILVIIDDCSNMFKEWCRKSKGILETVYNGRHYFITFIVTAQDDSEVDLKIRKNATVSIYSDATSATANFNRGERSKGDHNMARYVIDKLWRDDKFPNKGYRKMVFLSQSPDGNPFRYASYLMPSTTFKVGSRSFWKISDELRKKTRD